MKTCSGFARSFLSGTQTPLQLMDFFVKWLRARNLRRNRFSNAVTPWNFIFFLHNAGNTLFDCISIWILGIPFLLVLTTDFYGSVYGDQHPGWPCCPKGKWWLSAVNGNSNVHSNTREPSFLVAYPTSQFWPTENIPSPGFSMASAPHSEHSLLPQWMECSEGCPGNHS